MLNRDLYIKALLELRKNSYKGTISYSRYNEPMSFPELFKDRVAKAKEILPDCKLVSNTNGDYLTEENLNGLLIDELTIMDYDCKGIEHCINKLSNANVHITEIVDSKFVYGYYEDMKILYYVDWPKHAKIEDRGGSLEKFSCTERNESCKEPLYFLGIDYNGNVVPCCNVRSDNPEHKSFILGNLKDASLPDIHTNALMVAKTSLLNPSLLKPCKFCTKGSGRYTRENPGLNYE